MYPATVWGPGSVTRVDGFAIAERICSPSKGQYCLSRHERAQHVKYHGRGGLWVTTSPAVRQVSVVSTLGHFAYIDIKQVSDNGSITPQILGSSDPGFDRADHAVHYFNRHLLNNILLSWREVATELPFSFRNFPPLNLCSHLSERFTNRHILCLN